MGLIQSNHSWQVQWQPEINLREPKGMRGQKISREVRLDQDNDSVSISNGSGHTSPAFWTRLLFGSPSPAQCLMRFHRWSASSVSSLIYALWFESFRNSGLMISSVVGSTMPSLLPSFTQLPTVATIFLLCWAPALMCSHLKLSEHPQEHRLACCRRKLRGPVLRAAVL